MQKDIIYKQAAVELTMKYCSNDDGAIQCNRDIRELLDELENLPSAQPERKKGHWIGGDGSYICSECNGSPMDFIDTMGASFDIYVETPMNYCPNCGADMRGKIKNNE